jgi:hypothetical protein
MSCDPLRELKEALGRTLPPGVREDLDVGSAHDRLCKCEVCLRWWRHMTTKDDDDFGPFTKEEVHGK